MTTRGRGKPAKPPAPPVYELKVRRVTYADGKQTHSLAYLSQVGGEDGGARECRLHGELWNANADELAAWFAAHGVAVVREDQPGECDAPGGLVDREGE